MKGQLTIGDITIDLDLVEVKFDPTQPLHAKQLAVDYHMTVDLQCTMSGQNFDELNKRIMLTLYPKDD